MSLNKPIQLKLVGAALTLTLGLASCGSGTTTSTGSTTATGYYPITVNFTGASGVQVFTVAYPTGGTDTFSIRSGAILTLPAGTYTITPPTVGSSSPAAQTVTVGSSNPAQTVTFAY